jgi:hypothetical protein
MKINKLTFLLLPLVSFSTAIVAETSWIGNGSVMSRYEHLVSDASHPGPYSFGVKEDMTQLQTLGNKNAGFFQWFLNKNSCNKLEISTASNSQKVNITVGPWAYRNDDRTFSNMSLPFIIGSENVKEDSWFADNSWLVIGVEFLEKTKKEKEGLYATCSDKSETNSVYALGVPLMLEGYRWNGNGSIISGYFKSQYNDWKNPSYGENPGGNQWPFGVFKDVSKVHPDRNKQIVFFQHQKSSVCPNLTIDVLGANASEKKATLIYKRWNSLSTEEKTIRMPYTFSPEYLWTVFGVKFDTSFSQAYQVEASCSTGDNQGNIKPLNLNHKSMSDIAKHPNGCKFDDVPEYEWYAKYVKTLCLSGIVQGYSHTGYTKYGPGNNATGGELAAVVNLSNNYETTFERCRGRNNGANWAQCYLEIAQTQGFSMNQDDPVTRGNALRYFAKVFFNKSFSQQLDAGKFLQSKGIINGEGNSGIIDSDYLKKDMNRAELAKVALNCAKVSSDANSSVEKKKLPYGLIEEKISTPSESIHNDIEAGDSTGGIPESSIPEPPPKSLNDIEYGEKIFKNAEKTVDKESIFSGDKSTSDVDYVTTLTGNGVAESQTANELCNKNNLKSTPQKGDIVCYNSNTPGTNNDGHTAISDGNGNEIGVVGKGEPIQKRRTDTDNVRGYIPVKSLNK